MKVIQMKSPNNESSRAQSGLSCHQMKLDCVDQKGPTGIQTCQIAAKATPIQLIDHGEV